MRGETASPVGHPTTTACPDPGPPRLRSAVTGPVVRLKLAGLLLLAYLAFVPAPPAVAQARDATPSARELRQAYPLHASPEPGDFETSTPTSAPSDRPQEAGSSQASVRLAVAAVLAIIAFVAGFRLALRPPRERSSGHPPSSTDAVAVTPTDGPAPPIAALDRKDPSQAPGAAPAVALPPATTRGWTAETEWSSAGGEACFRIVARATEGTATAVVAESAQFEWPPADAAAVRALTAAAEELETRLVAAGWRQLPPGDSWYAKRFAWEPVASMPAAPGRFARRAAWPEHTEQTGRAK
jgi:hypothetical protein